LLHSALRPNPLLGPVFVLTLLALGTALFLPRASELFQFAPLDPIHLMEAVAAALASLLFNDIVSILLREIGSRRRVRNVADGHTCPAAKPSLARGACLARLALR
jgi:hypothetical protein